ncbi:MAG TPA: galactokinase [Rhodothermales bacterium]|nr:galactokinase [Rhodothermales bacterium]
MRLLHEPHDSAGSGITFPAEQVRTALEQHFGPGSGVHVALAPGRVNLIGDHTDYNDGFVFPMTIDRAVYVALRKRTDGAVRLLSLNMGQEVAYPLDDRPDVPSSSWASYVTGVVQELLQRSLIDSGFEAAVYGDVPLGSGLSSSAALEVAMVVALQLLFAFPLDPKDSALLCQQVEHQYAGVHCGIMDQFAARLGKEGHALFLDCRSLAYEHVPVRLGEMVIVIVDSKAPRSLARSAYNQRRAECEEGVAFFRRFDPSIQALRDVSLMMLDEHGYELPEHIRKRCLHVVSENRRVLEGKEALEHGRMEDFGRLMTQSHESLRDLYEVSSPQLDLLVDTALQVDGTLGARLTGAGFGGCTVNLVRKGTVPALREKLTTAYQKQFGNAPEVFVLERNLEAGSVIFERPS